MTEEVKFSIIIPIYKVEKYLHQCVDSILNQTFRNIEIILVDDGSPDNCGKICDDYAKQDSRVKVIHQQNLRSGESNVADKYGTSSTDFYIRCIKNKNLNTLSQIDDLQKYICDKAEEIILSRAEPTPYQILFNGILTKLTGHPNAFENFDDDLFLALKESDRFYTLENNETLSGNYWWIKGKKFDVTSSKTLTNRIKFLLKDLFEKNSFIEHTELLKIVYQKFPNGLSPDSVVLEKILLEYAGRKGILWQKK